MIHSRSKGEKTKNKGKWRNCGATVAQLWRNCGKKKGRLVSATLSLFPCPPFQKFPPRSTKDSGKISLRHHPKKWGNGEMGGLTGRGRKGKCRILQTPADFPNLPVHSLGESLPFLSLPPESPWKPLKALNTPESPPGGLWAGGAELGKKNEKEGAENQFTLRNLPFFFFFFFSNKKET